MSDVIADLGDGLVLRQAGPDDADALVAFNGRRPQRRPAGQPDRAIERWTRDLMTRPHPTVSARDFTVVEDTRAGAIVSSLNLISQTWTYGGVPFGVGRIELVGTAPRPPAAGAGAAQFAVVHGWSRQRGELVQAITGIPWYSGSSATSTRSRSTAAARSSRPRPQGRGRSLSRSGCGPAAEDDVQGLVDLDAAASRRYLVACQRDAALWRHELTGPSPAALSTARS